MTQLTLLVWNLSYSAQKNKESMFFRIHPVAHPRFEKCTCGRFQFTVLTRRVFWYSGGYIQTLEGKLQPM